MYIHCAHVIFTTSYVCIKKRDGCSGVRKLSVFASESSQSSDIVQPSTEELEEH